MQRLKLFVSLFFILFAAFAFLGQRWLTGVSAGRNLSGEVASLAAPGGVSASDADYIDKVGVMWNAVRGASLYRVFRSTSSSASSAAEVGTTAANYFFDATAQPDQNYFYWVRAESGGGTTSSLSSPDAGKRAAGQFQSSFFSPLSPPPVPVGNAVTAAKASLGKALFWDEQLSSTWTVSCGTCHRPAAGGSDPRTVAGNPRAVNPGFDNVFNTPDDVFGSPGVPLNNADGTYSQSNQFGFGEQVTNRKTPSYLNAGVAFAGLFWDGRAANAFRDPLTNQVLLTDWGSLESQIISPPTSSIEMAHGNRDWTQIAEQIASAKPLALAGDIPASLSEWINGRNYPELFEEAFGTPEVTPSRIALAIATHERTLFSDRAPIDRWGAQIEPLTAQEDRGREIFVAVNCSFCHGGPLLTDQNFHNVGVRPQIEDTGRGGFTGNAGDNGRFKTPGLRNVELRAPYMHNGRFATLEDVVEFYNRGGDFNAPNKDPRVRPLNLSSQQKADLVAFLKRPMTDPRVKNELPPFDRPKLYTESSRVPALTGTGRAGSGGIVPQASAIEPPVIGNPSFTIGVSKASGGAQAFLVIDSSDPGVGVSIPASGAFAHIPVNLSGASGSGNGFGSVSLPIPNNPALIGQTFYGRWYIADAGAANGFSVTQAFRFTIFGAASTAAGKTAFDYDGDRKADLSVFRPSNAYWYINNSSNNSLSVVRFGAGGDLIAPADFDGDGKTDIAVFRPSDGGWYRLNSSNNTFTPVQFGANGDLPVPGDFDGDGKADLTVYRPSAGSWYRINSSNNQFVAAQFGIAEDKPLIGDFDGDGKSDLTVFRPSNGTWYRINSATDTFSPAQFGAPGDLPVAADYDGDGKTDLAVYRPSAGDWYIVNSGGGSLTAQHFGVSEDKPAPADFDGDNKADLVVFRPSSGTWYLLRTTAGFTGFQFGAGGDAPTPNAFVR